MIFEGHSWSQRERPAKVRVSGGAFRGEPSWRVAPPIVYSIDLMADQALLSPDDVLTTDDFTIQLLPGLLSVAHISPEQLQGCSWPLLKSMFYEDTAEEEATSGFFSLTQDEVEVTIIMDERCRRYFDEASSVANVEYAPARWCAFELHLGSLAWEVPGLVCFLATLMAEAHISILNLSSHDRDFLLVQQSDINSAKRVIQQRLPRVSSGLKEAITEKAIVRRSGAFNSFSAGTASEREEILAMLESEERERLSAERAAAAAPPAARGAVATGDGMPTNGHGHAPAAAAAAAAAAPGTAAPAGGEAPAAAPAGALAATSADALTGAPASASTAGDASGAGGASPSDGAPGGSSLLGGSSPGSGGMPRIKSSSRELLDRGEGLFVRVLPTSLAVVRLQQAMLVPSVHALITRLLFTRSSGPRSFWSYTQTDGEISLIIDEVSLPSFPEEALVGSSSRWRPLRLCGRSFAFDETGVVSAM
jgi:hypothetical protein